MQINHTVQFQELLSITIYHGYYHSNQCGDFEVEFPSETLQIIKSYGIIVKQQHHKIIFLIDFQKDFNHFCFQGELKLDIKIRNRNPQFLHFTELPYLSNQCIHFEHKAGRNLLHHAENVTFDLCGVGTEGAGITGLIRITLNKENELFGIGPNEKSNLLPVRHTINFKERNVYWKYYIYGTSKYIEDIEYMYIVEKQFKDGVTFTNQGNVPLPNGKEAFLFTANHSLPLKERPSNQLGLFLNKGKNIENQLIKSLPCPNPRSISYDMNTGNFYVQEFIFI
ncbi:MAG: hypothetical protein KGQ86_00110 [Bacteroidetes bacterium]|nr:hypothetical protein [Bacteroidota bacterium]